MVLDLVGLDGWALVWLVLAAFAAGWVDAVVGGGGMVQLPALLMLPGLSPVQALATNKLASICGTATSALTYLRRLPVESRTLAPTALLAFLASVGGALLATWLPSGLFKPLIILALVAVLLYTVRRPDLGQLPVSRHSLSRQIVLGAAIGLVVGFYDGLLGPGTGSFLVILMISLLGYSFLQASASAKVVNTATNLGAILLF